MAEGLREFLVNGDKIESGDESSSSSASISKSVSDADEQQRARLQATDPANRTIDAGREHENMSKAYNALGGLMDHARNGHTQALDAIVERFATEAESLAVTIYQPIRDRNGRDPDQLGLKIINSQAEWESLEQDFEFARGFFPDIELQKVKAKKGKAVGVVIGVSAREFNAVLAAEKMRLKLEQGMKTRMQEMEKGRKDMGVDKMERVPSGNDMKAKAQTPAKEPAREAPSKGR